MRLIARLHKPHDTIRVLPAGLRREDGYLAIRDTPTAQHTEHIPWLGLDFYLMEKHVIGGYHWLKLCQGCHGQGWQWAPGPDAQGDPLKDMCPECNGQGGQ